MPDIEDLYASVPGLKADYKVDWKEDAKVDWKIDWDAVPGGDPGIGPSNDTLPVITGTAQVGQTLSVSTGAWSGNPDVYTYAYTWFADAVEIVGADEATLELTEDELGAVITAEVQATNTAGAAAVLTAATAAVIAA